MMEGVGSFQTENARLLDIPCRVCGDRSSGRHYGIYSCDGCSGFFKRTIHKRRVYNCKATGSSKGKCAVDKPNRNHCRACRLQKCLQMNMKKEAVQHERGPRRKIKDDKVERHNTSSKSHRETQNEKQEKSTGSKPAPNTISTSTTQFKTSRSLFTPVTPPESLSYAVKSCEFCGIGSSEQIMSTISWVLNNQPAFKVLPHVDRELLMISSWRLLHLMDKLYLHTVPRRSGIPPALMQCCRLPDFFLTGMTDVSQIMQLFRCLMLDVIELACLKMIVLYNSDAVHAVSKPMVARLQTETHLLLLEHISCYHPREVTRYGSLLMLLNILKTLSQQSIAFAVTGEKI